jgi:hypothetical protein
MNNSVLALGNVLNYCIYHYNMSCEICFGTSYKNVNC